MKWLKALPKRCRRGSCPRCLLLTHGDRPTVAERLQHMVATPGVTVSPDDYWMPQGLPIADANGAWDLSPTREAKLGQARGLLPEDQRPLILDWFLAVRRGANTPNWDIASTCTIDGTRGLLLVEAKAHDRELSTAGKRAPSTPNGWRNHARIGQAIAQANTGLNGLLPGWALSRDTHYQLSNRLAWAWKLADLGIPVALVYLGYLRAEEMRDRGEPFDSAQSWRACVHAYAKGVVPSDAWGYRLEWAGTPIWLLTRALDLALA